MTDRPTRPPSVAGATLLVAGLSGAAFLGVFSGLAIQMESGRDPALRAQAEPAMTGELPPAAPAPVVTRTS